MTAAPVPDDGAEFRRKSWEWFTTPRPGGPGTMGKVAGNRKPATAKVVKIARARRRGSNAAHVLLAQLETVLNRLLAVAPETEDARGEAWWIIAYTLRAILHYPDFDPSRLQRAARVLRGEHPDQAQVGKVKRVAWALEEAADGRQGDSELAPGEETGQNVAFGATDDHVTVTVEQMLPLILTTLRAQLRHVDPRFDDATDEQLVDAARKPSRPGAVADLLIATRALDTPPDADRSKLQRTLTDALKRKRAKTSRAKT